MYVCGSVSSRPRVFTDAEAGLRLTASVTAHGRDVAPELTPVTVDTLPLSQSLLEFYRGEIRKSDDEREHFLSKLKEVGVTQEEIHHERREISREQCESLQVAAPPV